jgi:hypothetical protein
MLKSEQTRKKMNELSINIYKTHVSGAYKKEEISIYKVKATTGPQERKSR